MLRQALARLAKDGRRHALHPIASVDQRLAASFDLAPVGMAHVALDGRWLRVNSRCRHITGYDESELLGSTFHQITHPDDLERDLSAVARLLAGETEGYTLDKRYIRKDGSSIWVNLTVTLVRDAGHVPDFLLLVIQDISDRKAVEVRLVDSEARYRAIFESAVEATAVIDASGTIQSINPAMRRTFGYENAELIGRNIRTLLPGHIAGKHGYDLERYRAGGERAIIGIGREVEGTHKDGSPIAIELSVAEWERDGQTFFTGIMRDISPRRAAESALRSSEESLRALQNEYAHLARVNEMGEMAAAIAHEINQPLTAIVNNLNAGLFATTDGLSLENFKEAEEVMTEASHQALRAGEIVRRLREFVGKSGGERRIEKIEALLDAATGLALIDAHAKGIAIDRVSEAGDVEVRVDAVQLQQVIVNLLRNAIDALMTLPATAERSIRIATRLIDDGQMVEIRISDTGPGIHADIAEGVFQPFFTSKAKGMGMGLSVCRRLIEAHEGSIDLEQPSGAGASFRVQLPRYRD